MATGHALAIPRPSLEVKSIASHSPEKPSPIPPLPRAVSLSHAHRPKLPAMATIVRTLPVLPAPWD